MHIFLTGVTGSICSVIAEHLQQGSDSVLGLARSESSANRLSGRGIEPFRGNLRDAASLIRGVQQADVVIHAGFTLDMMQTLTGFLMTQIATAVATYSSADHQNQGFACGCSTSGCGVETENAERVTTDQNGGPGKKKRSRP